MLPAVYAKRVAPSAQSAPELDALEPRLVVTKLIVELLRHDDPPWHSRHVRHFFHLKLLRAVQNLLEPARELAFSWFERPPSHSLCDWRLPCGAQGGPIHCNNDCGIVCVEDGRGLLPLENLADTPSMMGGACRCQLCICLSE